MIRKKPKSQFLRFCNADKWHCVMLTFRVCVSGVPGSAPSTLTTLLPTPVPSSSSSNRPTTTLLTTRDLKVPRVSDSDPCHHTPGWPSVQGFLSQFKSLPPTTTPATREGTMCPRWQEPNNTHVHMHPPWKPSCYQTQILDIIPQALPLPKDSSPNSNPLPPTPTPPTLEGTMCPRWQGTRTRMCTCLWDKQFEFQVEILDIILQACPRIPLPIQITPTYSHSSHSWRQGTCGS